MNTIYQKYLKYKQKYKQSKIQNGGAKKEKLRHDNNIYFKSNDKIINLIEKNDIETIKDQITNILFGEHQYCETVIGEGAMGQVIISPIGKTIDVVCGEKIINMSVVIKKATWGGEFNIKIIDNVLYIYSVGGLVAETILLSYASEMWRNKLSPHLPYMIGYSSCDQIDNKSTINKIITERHGLDEDIKIKLDGFVEYIFWFPLFDYDYKNPYIESNLSTLIHLLRYIKFTIKNDIITLPNNQTCNAVELCDYLSISYLHTLKVFAENNITLADMHFNNIFIHWLNKKSYMGDQNIGNIKNIIYKSNNNFIKIKTFGIVLKAGDIGFSILHPRDDVYILGQVNDLENTHHFLNEITKPNHSCHLFMKSFRDWLPIKIFEKTVIGKILSTYPYNELGWDMATPYNLLQNLLTPDQLLAKYTDYFVRSPKEKNNTLIVGT